ncbi:MAG TPA: MgtC/SapB family protein [Steroidobacteraceae bacterium]|jgi:putative Mg2+ transporter-C (MgtC) family protein
MHLSDFFSVEPEGQALLQLGELSLALMLSALIGLEREHRMKSAGLRTHTLVGVASALIVLISKYGFSDVLSKSIILDPSRVAAQIVSGIGFIGGGLIFVQRDVVRGLTTAAIIWLTAAIGMACGAGLPLLALFATGGHFIVIYAMAPLAQRVLSERAELEVEYLPGRGAVEQILQMCAGREFSIHDLAMRPGDAGPGLEMRAMHLDLRGRRGIDLLAVSIGDISGVVAVRVSRGQGGNGGNGLAAEHPQD